MPNKLLKTIKSNPYLLYTILFMLLYIPVVQIYFWRSGTSYIWGYDGLRQHFPFFIYIGEFIRKNFGYSIINTFDLSIGMGGDVFINTVGGMILDPFNWISALVPLKYSEIAYNLIIYIKMLISGYAFIFLSKEKRNTVVSSVAGALVYVFSASIFIGYKQAFFLVPFYIFPLLIAGFLRVWNGGKSKLYFLSLTVFSIESFYFTYMAGLMIAVLFIVKCIEDHRNKFGRKIITTIGKFIVPTITAILAGIGVNLPVIMNLYATDRLSVTREMEVFYPLKQCASMLIYYFGAYDTESDAFTGISAFFLISAVVIFSERKQFFTYKVMWILGTVSLFLPVVGSVFNGFNYGCDRFVFGYALLLSMIVADTFEQVKVLSKRQNIILIITAVVICIINAVIGILMNEEVFFAPILSILFVIGIFELSRKYLKPDQLNKAYIVSIAISLCLGSLQFFSYFADEELKNGNMIQIIEENKSEAELYNRTDDLKFMYFESNMAMLSGKSSFDFYSSYYNNDVNKYLVDLGVLGTHYSSQYSSLHGRYFLELLNGTNKLNIDGSYNNYMPYGYEDGYDSSLVYFADKKYSVEDYEKSDAFQKEEMMFSGIVTENGSDTFSQTLSEVNYEIIPRNGISIENNKVVVTEDTGTLVLKTEGLTEGEMSILINNLSGDGGNILAGITDGNKKITTDYFTYLNKADVTFTRDRDWLVNTGFGDLSSNMVYITFPKGTHSFDSIKLYVRDKDYLDSATQKFYESAKIQDVKYHYSHTSLLIVTESESDTTLYFAIPYSKGWKVIVNTQPQELYKANTCFMATDIKKGENLVFLRYRTPYLAEGLVISVVAFGAGIVYLMIEGRKKSRKAD